MLYLENTVKGGLILRAQQAEGLQISTEDKTGRKTCFLQSVRGLLSGSDVCHLFGCLCGGSVSCPGIELLRETAFLGREVEFQPVAVKLKGVCTHIGERLFPYFW